MSGSSTRWISSLYSLLIVASAQVEAQQDQCYESPAISGGEAVRDGIMFDVEVIDSTIPGVLINGLRVETSKASADELIDVWFVTDGTSYVGKEADQTLWSRVDTRLVTLEDDAMIDPGFDIEHWVPRLDGAMTKQGVMIAVRQHETNGIRVYNNKPPIFRGNSVLRITGGTALHIEGKSVDYAFAGYGSGFDFRVDVCYSIVPDAIGAPTPSPTNTPALAPPPPPVPERRVLVNTCAPFHEDNQASLYPPVCASDMDTHRGTALRCCPIDDDLDEHGFTVYGPSYIVVQLPTSFQVPDVSFPLPGYTVIECADHCGSISGCELFELVVNQMSPTGDCYMFTGGQPSGPIASTQPGTSRYVGSRTAPVPLVEELRLDICTKLQPYVRTAYADNLRLTENFEISFDWTPEGDHPGANEIVRITDAAEIGDDSSGNERLWAVYTGSDPSVLRMCIGNNNDEVCCESAVGLFGDGDTVNVRTTMYHSQATLLIDGAPVCSMEAAQHSDLATSGNVDKQNRLVGLTLMTGYWNERPPAAGLVCDLTISNLPYMRAFYDIPRRGLHARTFCSERDAFLPSVHSAAENRLLGEFVTSYGWGNNCTWLGVNDIEQEGILVNDDGTQVDYSNFRNSNSGDDDCVGIRYSETNEDGFEWEFHSCNSDYQQCKFSCDTPDELSPRVQLTFLEAEEFCSMHGQRLCKAEELEDATHVSKCDSRNRYMWTDTPCGPTPTSIPAPSPTSAPTPSPTSSPTVSPTMTPTSSPTSSPTIPPTFSPTISPTPLPTSAPTFSPTISSTSSPTSLPTAPPTPSPTSSAESPSTSSSAPLPTSLPTASPTYVPSSQPSAIPTNAPFPARADEPSTSPTPSPTKSPVTLTDVSGGNDTSAPTPMSTIDIDRGLCESVPLIEGVLHQNAGDLLERLPLINSSFDCCMECTASEECVSYTVLMHDAAAASDGEALCQMYSTMLDGTGSLDERAVSSNFGETTASGISQSPLESLHVILISVGGALLITCCGLCMFWKCHLSKRPHNKEVGFARQPYAKDSAHDEDELSSVEVVKRKRKRSGAKDGEDGSPLAKDDEDGSPFAFDPPPFAFDDKAIDEEKEDAVPSTISKAAGVRRTESQRLVNEDGRGSVADRPKAVAVLSSLVLADVMTGRNQRRVRGYSMRSGPSDVELMESLPSTQTRSPHVPRGGGGHISEEEAGLAEERISYSPSRSVSLQQEHRTSQQNRATQGAPMPRKALTNKTQASSRSTVLINPQKTDTIPSAFGQPPAPREYLTPAHPPYFDDSQPSTLGEYRGSALGTESESDSDNDLGCGNDSDLGRGNDIDLHRDGYSDLGLDSDSDFGSLADHVEHWSTISYGVEVDSPLHHEHEPEVLVLDAEAPRVRGAPAQKRKVKSCDKLTRCSLCSKVIKGMNNFRAHLREQHAAVPKFQCNLCSKRFRRKFNMTVHMRTHFKKKPYECADCGESFAQSSNYTRHVRNNHKKPFKCPKSDCKHRCSSRDEVSVHFSKAHPGVEMPSIKERSNKPRELTFRCQCRKRFQTVHELVSHQSICTRADKPMGDEQTPPFVTKGTPKLNEVLPKDGATRNQAQLDTSASLDVSGRSSAQLDADSHFIPKHQTTPADAKASQGPMHDEIPLATMHQTAPADAIANQIPMHDETLLATMEKLLEKHASSGSSLLPVAMELQKALTLPRERQSQGAFDSASHAKAVSTNPAYAQAAAGNSSYTRAAVADVPRAQAASFNVSDTQAPTLGAPYVQVPAPCVSYAQTALGNAPHVQAGGENVSYAQTVAVDILSPADTLNTHLVHRKPIHTSNTGLPSDSCTLHTQSFAPVAIRDQTVSQNANTRAGFTHLGAASHETQQTASALSRGVSLLPHGSHSTRADSIAQLRHPQLLSPLQGSSLGHRTYQSPVLEVSQRSLPHGQASGFAHGATDAAVASAYDASQSAQASSRGLPQASMNLQTTAEVPPMCSFGMQTSKISQFSCLETSNEVCQPHEPNFAQTESSSNMINTHERERNNSNFSSFGANLEIGQLQPASGDLPFEVEANPLIASGAESLLLPTLTGDSSGRYESGVRPRADTGGSSLCVTPTRGRDGRRRIESFGSIDSDSERHDVLGRFDTGRANSASSSFDILSPMSPSDGICVSAPTTEEVVDIRSN